MSNSDRKYEMDMASGPLLGKIIWFAIPVLLSGLLQTLYNAADTIVVGQFAGAEALAAVGSTGSFTNLMINLFLGLSVGASAVVARNYGAGMLKDVSETVHTAVAIALIGGVLVAVVGVAFSRQMLELMGSPEDVIDLATLYLRIYFLGVPVNLLYNFGAAILRAVGDTKRPLYYLSVSGIINVLLNLVFVIVLHMSVAGVALATVISQCVSMVLVFKCLIRTESSIRLELRSIRVHAQKALEIVRIGLPAGVQSALFSFSNVLIQSTINSFGSTAMAGNAAASNIESFVGTAMNSLYQAAITFTSQNLGAKKKERLKPIIFQCLGLVTALGVIFGWLTVAFDEQLLRIYTTDPEAIAAGVVRIRYMSTSHFLVGVMNVFVGGLRGLGYSFVSMIISLLGACALRVVWIYTVFQLFPVLDTVYLSYPISWGLTALAQGICYARCLKKTIVQIDTRKA